MNSNRHHLWSESHEMVKATTFYTDSLIFIAFIYWGGCSHVERSKDNLKDLVLSSHHVHSGGQIQVVRVGNKCLYSLSHPACPGNTFLGHSLGAGAGAQQVECLSSTHNVLA